MSISGRIKAWLVTLLKEHIHQAITDEVARRFSTGREVLRHKIPEREPRTFTYDNRQ